MKNGIYLVEFYSNTNSHGGGLIVVNDGLINGGDNGYLYLGKISVDNTKFVADLHIKQWNSASESVFGPIPEFDLNLEGQFLADSSFNAQGNIKNQPGSKLSVKGRYLSPLSA